MPTSIDEYLQKARGLGDASKALAVLDEARREHGNHDRLLFAMAGYFRDLGMNDAALQLFAALKKNQSANSSFLNNYALALDAAGKREDALGMINSAVALEPDNAELLITRAMIERHGRDDAASEVSLNEALRLNPQHPVAMMNLAELLTDKDDLVGCLALQRKASALLDSPLLRHNMAQTLFKLGQLAEAWQLYEARFEAMADGKPRVRPRPTTLPRWDGQPIKDGKLLVWMEQGVGEEILYASLLRETAARAGNIIVECDPRLQPLFARSFPDVTIVSREAAQETDKDPSLKAQIAAASLGGLFRNKEADFIRHQGYLKANAVQAAQLKNNYVAQDKKIIGLSWRSKPRRYADNKSMDFESFITRYAKQDATYISLQYGDVREEVVLAARLGINLIHDVSVDALISLDDFAAQVAACDEVVTISNTTAHMAGALNIPTTVLAPKGVDAPHHWFHGRGNSPWYPSLKLLVMSN